MRTHTIRLISACLLAATVAACGGGGNAGTVPNAASLANTSVQQSATSSTDASRATSQTAAIAVPSGTYWSGTVTEFYGTQLTANCGQSNFAQGFGCIPVSFSQAVVTGTPVKGQYFQLWGDLSKLPAVTATTINFGPNPFPATAPSAAPATSGAAAAPAPSPSTVPKTSATAAPNAPSGMPAGAPAWTGTVSGSTGAGFTANCGQSNFAQQFGCIPVTTTGATIVGSLVAGTKFELWGDLSRLPNVTATYVIFSANGVFPAITSTPSGTATASPKPLSPATVAPLPIQVAAPAGSTFQSLPNAADWSTSYVPYAANSVWNRKISANPTFASYSSNVVASQFPGGVAAESVRSNEAGQYDYSHPRFFATNADPTVTLTCTQYCGAPDNGGIPQTIHIPAKARPAGGGDGHFDIVQPDGTEITAWGASSPDGSYHNFTSRDWKTGDALRAGNIANCGNLSSGTGWLASGPGPTAAGFCDQAGIVTAAELLAGRINHALFVVGECAVGNQYPSEPGASTQQCTSGVGPPLGGREWYDVPCATTQANASLRPWEKAILCALNEYGAYLGDDVGGGSRFTGGIAPEVESEEPWYDYGGANYVSPFAALASQGWSTIRIGDAMGSVAGTRWVGASPWHPASVNFPAHIHWLAPCSAQGSC